jgi:hypothetical protein
MPSTVIKSFRYDTASSSLIIIFVSGLVYKYLHVPKEVYEQMKNSFSKGIFFNNHIKGIYDFEKK